MCYLVELPFQMVHSPTTKWSQHGKGSLNNSVPISPLIICGRCNSSASMIPSSTAKASVISTEYVASSSLPLAATTKPLQSQITTPTLERIFSLLRPSFNACLIWLLGICIVVNTMDIWIDIFRVIRRNYKILMINK